MKEIKTEIDKNSSYYKDIVKEEITEGIDCSWFKDCIYYKQCELLKQENEELKQIKKEILKPIILPDIDEPEVVNRYKQALEEIRDRTIHPDGLPENCTLKKYILFKINEVLK